MGQSPIPFLDLKRVNAPHEGAILAATNRVVQAGRYVLGEEVRAFEHEWAEYCGVAHAVGLGTGLDALRLILEGYRELGRIPAGAEVLVPANTYFATHLTILQAGMVPILVDADSTFSHVDLEDLSRKITPKCKGMVVVPLHGIPEPMGHLKAFAQDHDLALIADAAQAHGASYAGVKTGAWSDAAAFSFYPTKNLGALGDAGAITTNDGDLAALVRQLRDYGRSDADYFQYQGINSRLDEFQAAILRAKLPHLDSENANRREIAEQYLVAISNPLVTLPKVIPQAIPVWHHFVVQVSQRDHFRNYLHDQGIGTALHYAVPPHHQPVWPKELPLQAVPMAEQIFRQCVSLPLFPGLSAQEVSRVIDAVNAYSA